MQKKIIALAIAAACAAPVAAMADSSFYGSMDGGLRHQTNDTIAAGGTTDSMKMGQYNTSRWGFKGVDDLGDGMKANVVVETSFVPYGVGGNPDLNSAAPANFSGVNQTNNPFGLIFDRQATVGMEGGFGKADVGWNYTTSYTVINTYDPFNYKFNAIALAKGAAQQDRAGNVTYSKVMGDLTVLAEYQIANGYQSRQPSTGTGRAIGATYTSGPINVGGSYTAQEDSVGTVDNNTHVTVGAGYNYGDGKVSVGYAKKATKSAINNDATDTNMWVGASFKMSPKIEATAAYYNKASNTGVTGANDSTTKQTIAMVTYAMSKKTTTYFEADRKVTNAGGGAADAVTSGFSAGLDVKF
jgi:predicted porin